jgi:beta-glucanase (GH16 family)
VQAAVLARSKQLASTFKITPGLVPRGPKVGAVATRSSRLWKTSSAWIVARSREIRFQIPFARGLSDPNTLLRTRASWIRRTRFLILTALCIGSLVLAGVHVTTGPRLSQPPASGHGWNLIFSDSFDGTHLDRSKWFTYDGQPGGDPAGYWASTHDLVSDGQLEIQAYRDKKFANRMVAGGVSSGRLVSQTYGKYLARVRVDPGSGVSWAALLWPANNHWPPEIDFAEDNGDPLRNSITASFHFGINGVLSQTQSSLKIDMTEWHTIGVTWTSSSIKYSIDGRTWASVHDTQIPFVPMVLDFQTQTWPCGTPSEACVSPATPAIVSLHIDWVAIYSITSN